MSVTYKKKKFSKSHPQPPEISNNYHPKVKSTRTFFKKHNNSPYAKPNNFAFHIDIMEQLKWKLCILLGF